MWGESTTEIRGLREEVRTLAKKLDALQQEREFPWWENPVLTTEQARIYIGARSQRTFHRKMQDWGIIQCAPETWPRGKIDAAMNRLSRQRFTSRKGRKSA